MLWGMKKSSLSSSVPTAFIFLPQAIYNAICISDVCKSLPRDVSIIRKVIFYLVCHLHRDILTNKMSTGHKELDSVVVMTYLYYS